MDDISSNIVFKAEANGTASLQEIIMCHSGGMVGIGTTPSVELDVNGDCDISGTLTATSLSGTLTTAAQANITSLGTLTGLTSSGPVICSSVIPSSSGQILQTLFYDKIDLGIDTLELGDTNTSYTDIFTPFQFIPISSSSKIKIECDANYQISGGANDEFNSRILVNTDVVSYKMEQFKDSPGASNRTVKILPISGIYRNTSTNFVWISVQVRRSNTDDILWVYKNSGISLSVQEIQS